MKEYDKKIIKNNWWLLRNEIREKMKEENVMNITNITKIVLNSGVGQDNDKLEKIKNIFYLISYGQKPTFTKAKKSIINFKLRKGTKIGCKLTLRKKKIWDFLFDLININFPRIPNFQGFSPEKFDSFGNYSFGIKNLNIFPTVPYEFILKNQGLQITIVFKINCKKKNKKFLNLLNFPFVQIK